MEVHRLAGCVYMLVEREVRVDCNPQVFYYGRWSYWAVSDPYLGRVNLLRGRSQSLLGSDEKDL